MYKELIIDVGANYGSFSLEAAKRNPDKLVIAFEPEPSLAEILENQSTQLGLLNHKVERLAVSSNSGSAYLNVSTSGDWGTSSLRSFNEEHLKKDEYWSERSDLKHTSKIEVQTITLEKYLDQIEYKQVSFLKIDAQGLDLEVLSSMGGHLSKLDGGMLEVPAIEDKALYLDENIDLRTALDSICSMGFKVYGIKPNDPASNEFNIYFCSSKLSKNKIEAQNRLMGIPIYDGKNYWHYPSSKLENIEAEIHVMKSEVQRLSEEAKNWEWQYKNLLNKPIIKLLIAIRSFFKF